MSTDNQQLKKAYSQVLKESEENSERKDRLNVLKNKEVLGPKDVINFDEPVTVKRLVDDMYKKYNMTEPGYAYPRIAGTLEGLINIYLMSHPKSELQKMLNNQWKDLYKDEI